MVIERLKNDQIVITLSASLDSFGVQRLIDYAKYLEATTRSKAKQVGIDKVADELYQLRTQKQQNLGKAEKRK